MLLSHLNAVESALLARSNIANNAGHTNLRGNPREWFIQEFLETHLPKSLEVGQGEVIDQTSQPTPPRGQYRAQIDTLLYRYDLPKIQYSPNNSAYLVEGVMAQIETKSIVNNAAIDQVCKNSVGLLSMTQCIWNGFGFQPPTPKTYLIGFDGPASMSTVVNNLKANQTPIEKMPDLVVVLGKGIAFRRNTFPSYPLSSNINSDWAYVDQSDKNLFLLFTHMLTWMSTLSSPPEMLGYANGRSISTATPL
ncbi:DUF6602 domain-containing protein [Vibrio cortegadensis]|uniref:DUF6602 domain-containing protein n=1 Tax=Vibrio cortegadensis TaxID=1328770 RepID=UPI00352E9EC0